jgi:hypothetical protein
MPASFLVYVTKVFFSKLGHSDKAAREAIKNLILLYGPTIDSA